MLHRRLVLTMVAALFAAAALAQTKQPPLRTGVDGTFAPHAMPKLGGGLEGFQIDLFTEVAKRMNREITIDSTSFSTLIPGMLSGRYDFIAAPTTVTKERAESMIFTAGYLAIWLAFSIIASVLQGELAGSAMTLRSPALGSIFLIAAGIYELAPLKSSCLRQCRSPAEFLSRQWRPGLTGAIRLGALHGAWCLGCCWLLMALLFVGGVMNLAWIAALSLLVAAEKLLPGGPWIGRAAGAALLAWAAATLIV